MHYDSNTPRAKVTIEGIELIAIAPFAEGHVVSATEAAVLNQTLRENLRNNTATAIKKAKADGADDQKLQALLDEYTTGYLFGVRKTGTGTTAKSLDPVSREARKIARDRVHAAIKAKGFKLKEVPADQVAGYVEALLAKDPSIMEAAKQIVATSKQVGAAELDLGDIVKAA